MSIDYKQLVADRKAKQSRPIVRHLICLMPELYADLEEAQSTRDALTEQDRRAEQDDDRAGSLSPLGAQLAAARQEVKDIEAQIAEVTIVGVFKAPTASKQGALSDEFDKILEANPEQANELTVANAKQRITEAFDHFEGPNRKPIDTLSRDDLGDMLEQWAQGEVMWLHAKIVKASTRELDAPFSVRQSLGARRSAETSSQPSK
jgi:hypothetical protein